MKLTSIAALATLLAGSIAHSTDSANEFRISAVRAYMFHEQSGRLDTRDAASSKLALWNTIIGEGDAGEPSSTTVVHVELRGPSFRVGTKGKLSLSAVAGGKSLLAQSVDISTFFSEGSKIVVPFVVFGTGCAPLELEAVLTVGKGRSVGKATVPFACGE